MKRIVVLNTGTVWAAVIYMLLSNRFSKQCGFYFIEWTGSEVNGQEILKLKPDFIISPDNQQTQFFDDKHATYVFMTDDYTPNNSFGANTKVYCNTQRPLHEFHEKFIEILQGV